ncbi:MAG: STAS domain-containing protein [Vicinamibacterales bacterium]
MQLDERLVGDVVVLVVSGDLTLNHGGDVMLKDKVRSLILQGRRKLVVDLGGVSSLDSAGLGELVQAYATTRNKGGSLKLSRLTPRTTVLLTITKLISVFECYDREADAIDSFSATV